MKEYDLSVNKELRETCMERVDVLEKVKKLFLIPGMEVMTTKQVAEYFEVDNDVIKKVYERNRDEIDSDGTMVKTVSDFRVGQNVTNDSELKGQNVTNVSTDVFEVEKKKQGSTILKNKDGMRIEVANRGVRCFSQRAILRIAMLLRDSEIAKEVRTQLLNTFEASTEENKTYAIEEEELLYLNMAKAIMFGDTAAALQAMCNVQQYQNRHIDALEKANNDLTEVNKLLAAGVNTWDNKAMLNAMVRSAAVNQYRSDYMKAWGAFYKQLLYKEGINLTKRSGEGSKISKIRDDEWAKVLQVAAAWIMEMGVDVVNVINSVNAAAITT